MGAVEVNGWIKDILESMNKHEENEIRKIQCKKRDRSNGDQFNNEPSNNEANDKTPHLVEYFLVSVLSIYEARRRKSGRFSWQIIFYNGFLSVSP